MSSVVGTNEEERRKHESRDSECEGERVEGRIERGNRRSVFSLAESFHRVCNTLTAYSTGLPTS